MENNLNSQELHSNFDRLESLPLFHFSLHAKELFHSNFLVWMAKDKDLRLLFKKVMVGIGIDEKIVESWGDKFEVVREEQNLDILIKAKDTDTPTWYAVIENKVKSIPTSEQLDKYTKTIGKVCKKAHRDPKEVKKILLTLDGYNENLPEGWQPASYSQISTVLTKSKIKISNSYKKEIVKDYNKMLQSLIEIINYYKVSLDNKFLLETEDKEDLQQLRIDDLVDKWRAAQMASKFNMEYGSKYSSECTQNYTNNQPLIEVYRHMKDDKTEKDIEQVTIGVQIQGKQYRHCIIAKISEDDVNEIPKASFGFLCEGRETFRNKMIKKHPDVFENISIRGEKNKKFCSYDKKKKGKIFWYQYATIKEDATIKDIFECMAADLKEIEEIKRAHFGC